MGKIIIKNCNVGEVDIPLKLANKLYNDLKVRHPNAFYLTTRMRNLRNWDGYVKFLSASGQFKIGLLPRICKLLREYGYEDFKVIDLRKPVPIIAKPITKIGKFKLRPEQIKAVEAVLHNKVEGLPFHIGVIDYTVNAGKCNGKNTWVYTDQGLFKIKDLVNKDGSLKFDFKLLGKDGKYHIPTEGIFNRIKALRITTKRGYSQICGYDNHRFYTLNSYGNFDWVYAKDLKVGDSIPLYKSSPGINPNACTDPDLAYLLGVISGDGHVHIAGPKRLVISVSEEDSEIFEKIAPTWSKYAKSPVEIKPHRKFQGYYLSKSSTDFTNLMWDYYPELIGSSWDKYVPSNILNSSEEVKWAYIAGLIDTDGHNDANHRSISFSTVCKKNARLIHLMLLTLGVPSTLRKKKVLYNGVRSHTWRITIASPEYDYFLSKVPIQIPRKKQPIRNIRNNYGNRLPKVMGDKVSELYGSLKYILSKDSRKELGKTTIKQLRVPNRITQEALSKFNKVYPNNYLQDILSFNDKVYWDEIQSIEVLEKYDCYDICVPDVEHYITNGFISHNTLIMSALYLSFKRKLKTLLITNDSDWLNQSREEFKQYLPGEDITFVQGAGIKNWANFSIGMIQTLSRNIRSYQSELSQIDMVLVDEADLAGSKQYQNVLTHLYNTRVRIGLSGTIYMSNKAKDRLKNMGLESFFGPTIAQFTLKQSIKKGYSTNTIVKLVPYQPWFGNWESSKIAYLDIYNETITNNRTAWKMALDRLKFNLSYGRIPALVVCKIVAHAENLYKYLKKHLKDYRIGLVHVNTNPKLRAQTLSDFREGKIDILVSTTIIARGKNFPLLKCMINAASMDSQEKSIQFLGRLVRTHEGKSRVYLDDLHYPGNYLDRHGKHRKIYYKKLGIKVIDLSKLPIHTPLPSKIL